MCVCVCGPGSAATCRDASAAKAKEEKRQQERRRGLLINCECINNKAAYHPGARWQTDKLPAWAHPMSNTVAVQPATSHAHVELLVRITTIILVATGP